MPSEHAPPIASIEDLTEALHGVRIRGRKANVWDLAPEDRDELLARMTPEFHDALAQALDRKGMRDLRYLRTSLETLRNVTQTMVNATDAESMDGRRARLELRDVEDRLAMVNRIFVNLAALDAEEAQKLVRASLSVVEGAPDGR